MTECRNININIPIDLKNLLDDKIDAGQFASIDDFMLQAANEYLALDFDLATQEKIILGVARAEQNEAALQPITAAFDLLDKIHLAKLNSAA
jgi:Arc/MetJ-type ribon-helix-helix transcriptional regulator